MKWNRVPAFSPRTKSLIICSMLALGVVRYSGMTEFSGCTALDCNVDTLYHTTAGRSAGGLYTLVVCLVVDDEHNWYEFGGHENPPIPGSASWSCAPYSATNTDSAKQNFVTCSITACAGDTIVADTCSSVTDTYLRLFDGAAEVASDDDACAFARGSKIIYNVPAGGACRTFSLHQGCFSSGSCSATSSGIVACGGASDLARRPASPVLSPEEEQALIDEKLRLSQEP